MGQVNLSKKSSEWKRGYNYVKKEVAPRYRSFWIEKGSIYGYTLEGSKHRMYAVEDLKMRTNDFDGGFAQAAREMLRDKPKRQVRRPRPHPVPSSMGVRPFG